MSDTFERLKVRLGEIYDLERVGFLLAWDQETTMPPDGAPARAEQRATIGRAAHERLGSDELDPLLRELRGARRGRRARARRAVPGRSAAGLRARPARTARVRSSLVAPRPQRAPVRGEPGHLGHPADGSLHGGPPERDLRDRPRVRARPLRA